MTIREIAAAVDRAELTVRRWLTRYGLGTRHSSNAERQRAARAAGLASATLDCPQHGEAEHALSGDGYYRCKQCRVEAVVRRRRKVKELLVSDAGGRCLVCGYDRYIGALHFHHLDPAEKRMALGGGGVTLALETLRSESRKCVLLCSNCHAEVEAGVTQLPDTVAEAVHPSA
jgi:5-methylcytosine-specific restriction endonuclease McrA